MLDIEEIFSVLKILLDLFDIFVETALDIVLDPNATELRSCADYQSSVVLGSN
jgi:hypothetical protein